MSCGSNNCVDPRCVIDPESGGVVPAWQQAGYNGTCEYWRSVQESRLARFNPDVLSEQVEGGTNYGAFLSLITPAGTPAPVTYAGYDVFGPPAYHTSTRNMIVGDLRGEAATGPLVGAPPVGGAVSSLMGSATGFDANYRSCDYQPPPYPSSQGTVELAQKNAAAQKPGFWKRVFANTGSFFRRT